MKEGKKIRRMRNHDQHQCQDCATYIGQNQLDKMQGQFLCICRIRGRPCWRREPGMDGMRDGILRSNSRRCRRAHRVHGGWRAAAVERFWHGGRGGPEEKAKGRQKGNGKMFIGQCDGQKSARRMAMALELGEKKAAAAQQAEWSKGKRVKETCVGRSCYNAKCKCTKHRGKDMIKVCCCKHHMRCAMS